MQFRIQFSSRVVQDRCAVDIVFLVFGVLCAGSAVAPLFAFLLDWYQLILGRCRVDIALLVLGVLCVDSVIAFFTFLD